MADQNPFAAIFQTPEMLDARRRYEFAEQSKGQDFWVKAAGMQGLDLRRDLLAKGIGLGPEDRRALQTQEIMGRAQRNLAEMIKNGDLDPLDAQEEVIRRAMGDFMTMGDYQSAQGLLPGLNQIRDYKLNLEKLRSEGVENRASAFKSTAEGQRALAVTPSEIQKNQSESLENVAQAGQAEAYGRQADAGAYRNRAQGDLYNRTDPNLRASGSKDGGAVTPQEAARVRQQGSGALNLFDRMADLSTFYQKAPIVASKTAAGENIGFQYLQGFWNSLKRSGGSVGGFEGLSDSAADGAGGQSPKAIVRQHSDEIVATAKKLGFRDITQFESLVIDAAYALARANDPGGRLSNNDFTFALQSLGAVQDQQSALKAFRALAKRGYDNFKNLKKTYQPEAWNDNFSNMESEVEAGFKNFEATYGSSDVKDVQKETAEEKRKAELRAKYLSQ